MSDTTKRATRSFISLASQVRVQSHLQSVLVCVDAHAEPKLFEYTDSHTDASVARAMSASFVCTPANVRHVREQLFGELRARVRIATSDGERVRMLEEQVRDLSQRLRALEDQLGVASPT